MRQFTFITGNAAKAKYMADFFHMSVEHVKLDLPEIQSLDLQEVVEDKAQRAWEIVKKPVIVEDVSLIFNALGKLPGPLIKWFLESLGNDGLCALLSHYDDRSATAEVATAYAKAMAYTASAMSRRGVSRRNQGERKTSVGILFSSRTGLQGERIYHAGDGSRRR